MIKLILKRIVAYSPLTQISLSFLILIIGFEVTCLTLLIVHAIFKASLFMFVGLIIHDNYNIQDSRVVKFNSKLNTVKYSLLIILILSIVGFVYSIGYFKDIVWNMFGCWFNLSLVIYYQVFFIIITISLYYAFELLFRLFIDSLTLFNYYNESLYSMIISLCAITSLLRLSKYNYLNIYFDDYLYLFDTEATLFILAALLIVFENLIDINSGNSIISSIWIPGIHKFNIGCLDLDYIIFLTITYDFNYKALFKVRVLLYNIDLNLHTSFNRVIIIFITLMFL